jgi:hypothetical protein
MISNVRTWESLLAIGAVVALGAAAVLGYRRANGRLLLARPVDDDPPERARRKPRRKSRQA